jgi:hypothetical protein
MKWFEEKGKCEKGCLVRGFLVIDERGQEGESGNFKIVPRLR